MASEARNGDNPHCFVGFSDLVRLDWMEDHHDEAIRILTEDRDSVMASHMLRIRIDEAMSKPNKGIARK